MSQKETWSSWKKCHRGQAVILVLTHTSVKSDSSLAGAATLRKMLRRKNKYHVSFHFGAAVLLRLGSSLCLRQRYWTPYYSDLNIHYMVWFVFASFNLRFKRPFWISSGSVFTDRKLIIISDSLQDASVSEDAKHVRLNSVEVCINDAKDSWADLHMM